MYSGVFLVAIGGLVEVSSIIGNNTFGGLGAAARDAQVMLGVTAFTDVWYVAKLLFGLCLLVIGYLAFRSG